MNPTEYLKAIVGAVLAGLTALQVALNPLADEAVQITSAEWVGIAIATVATFAAVWGTPNKPPQ